MRLQASCPLDEIVRVAAWLSAPLGASSPIQTAPRLAGRTDVSWPLHSSSDVRSIPRQFRDVIERAWARRSRTRPGVLDRPMAGRGAALWESAMEDGNGYANPSCAIGNAPLRLLIVRSHTPTSTTPPPSLRLNRGASSRAAARAARRDRWRVTVAGSRPRAASRRSSLHTPLAHWASGVAVLNSAGQISSPHQRGNLPA